MKDFPEELADRVTSQLMRTIPREQCLRVFDSEMCDISPEFLGFVHIYDALAKVIPEEWTIVDLGCAYAPQAFLFTRHERYIGVDILTPIENRFSAGNTEHHFCSIRDWISRNQEIVRSRCVFAICSYVPNWEGDNGALVRGAFRNCFVYYPESNMAPIKVFANPC